MTPLDDLPPSLTARRDITQLPLFSENDAAIDQCKDTVLAHIGSRANVAQFVSFGPDATQRYSAIRGEPYNKQFASAREAIERLLENSVDNCVNVRSFHPCALRNRPFLYGLRGVANILEELHRITDSGLYAIVNETIDIHDGGVSGVAHGGVIEFAPGDTPRCVEKPGVATLERAFGLAMLKSVYGIAPELHNLKRDWRIEFSLHPVARGHKHRHTIIWEIDPLPPPSEGPLPDWPNRFSRAMGDKAYGLLVAHLFGFAVPSTFVLPRVVPGFRFGTHTATSDVWIRTCPHEKVPGKYSTIRGWSDPFKLMEKEDPTGTELASIIIQEGVDPHYSGAAETLNSGEPGVEGVRGVGTDFMLGRKPPETLPRRATAAIEKVYRDARQRLGPVRFEWVLDGKRPWLVQLHRQRHLAPASVIVPGDVAVFEPFEVTDGLEALRDVIGHLPANHGIEVIGRVGRTSHICDLLRQYKVPSRFQELTSA